MIVHNMEQGTDEWFEIRLGKFTASVIDSLFAGKTTASYRNCISKVADERIVGKKPDDFNSSYYMDRGNEMEMFAVQAYEEERFQRIKLIGFCESDDHKSGCSPDGLIGDNGMIQIKCPKYSTMFEYIKKDHQKVSNLHLLGRAYFNQVQHEMMVTDREWSDFVLYHPGLPLIIRRVEKDLLVHAQIAQEIIKAEKEVGILIKLVQDYEHV